jgi:MFS family permease
VRYGVLGFLCALSFVLYLDRICMGQATVPIQDELGLSNTAMGWVHAAFIIAYGLFEVPTGRWGDRHGSRGVLVRICVWWSAFTALTGAVSGLAMLLVVRFLFGAGEAGALPNSARVVARWFPVGGRGPAQGAVTTSALVGGVLAPIAAQALIVSVGWRWTFVVFGLVGVVWALAFYFWFRDDPAGHPDVNVAERLLIKGIILPSGFGLRMGQPSPPSTKMGIRAERSTGAYEGSPPMASHPETNIETPTIARDQPMVAADYHPPVPWRLVLASKNIWLLGGVISCSAFASYLYFSWYPKYLEAARGVSPGDTSLLTSLVLGGGAIGCLLGGFLGDWLARRNGERRWSRRLLGCCGLSSAAMWLLASIHCDTPIAAVLCTSLASLSSGLALPIWWAVVTDVSGRHLGAVFGLLNSLGVPGAFASQVFFGWMADRMKDLGHTGRAQYDPAFYVYTGVLLVGALGWLFIHGRPIVESEHGKECVPR